MLTRKERIYVALSSYFLAVIGLFFTGSSLWFLLVLVAIVYAVIGGKKHV